MDKAGLGMHLKRKLQSGVVYAFPGRQLLILAEAIQGSIFFATIYCTHKRLLDNTVLER